MQYIKHFKTFIDELSNSNSRLYKMSVIDKYKNDSVIMYFLTFLYNPFITTGISDKKLNKEVDIDIFYMTTFNSLNITDSTSLLEYLKENNSGRDNDIKVIKSFIKKMKDVCNDYNNIDDLVFILNKLITKNLQLGIDSKTINKIKNVIPTFNVMLANSYFDNPTVIENKEFALTTKIDGGRIIAIKKNEEVSFYTRSGQKYDGLVDLEKEMLENMPDNIALDGEITLLNPGDLTSKDQYKETMKITRKLGEKHGVKMKVFDFMSADDFLNQRCSHKYSVRRNALGELFKQNYSFFELLPVLYTGTDVSQIFKILDEQIERGEEGIMINITDSQYEFKRTNNLLKVKKMKDIDLEVIGFEEGNNKYSGMLGSLLVDYKGFVLKVGSGFSEKSGIRQEIWNNRDKYLGLTATIQYFEETSNANGEVSLRFPVFLDFRYDK